MVVNLDGPVIREATAIGLDGWPAEHVEAFVESGWIPPPTVDDLADVLSDAALREFVGARERRQPTATLTTPFPDTGERRWRVPHVYLACTEAPSGEPFTEEDLAMLAAIQADPRWDYRELALNHLALLYEPEAVATALLEVIQERSDQGRAGYRARAPGRLDATALVDMAGSEGVTVDER
jgi:hypothetical protein